jgi:catecholate siderophore receptor
MKNRTVKELVDRPRRRRRGTSRLFVLGAAFVASTSAGGALSSAHAQEPNAVPQSAGAPAPSTFRFSIPAGPIAMAIERFQALTGIRIDLADGSLRNLPAPGVRGMMTPRQALDRLLAGTGLGYTFTDPGVVRLGVRTSETVEVAGRARDVSSPTFTQPLRDIPQTIAVIPRDVIQSQGATTLRDVLRNVPGITFRAGEGGGGLPGDNFTMRGFSAGNDMFVDGLRDAGGYSRDAFNLEQVEVAKGPSSSIAGRGATGGAINQVTKSPHLQESSTAALGVGNADYRRGTVDVNQPLGALGAAFRLNAMWTDAGVPGRQVVEGKGWGVAPSLAIGLGRPTHVTLKYQHLTQDNVPDYGLPWGNYPGYPTGAFAAAPPIDQSNFYGLRDYDFEDIRSDIATAEVAHQFGNGFTLRNITRYSDITRDSAITAPRPPNRQLQRRTMGNGSLANQTNASAFFGSGRVRHDVVAGVELSRETTDNRNSAQAGNQPQTDIVNPNPGDRPLGPMPANAGNPGETHLSQAGVYLFETLSLGQRWQLTGGARLDLVDVDYSMTTVATGAVSHLERSDSMLSWRGGIVYKPRPEGSVYFGYGTSFNPSVDAAASGAALGAAPTAANSPSLEPEETRNYEVGAKWDVLTGRLSLTSAVFRTEKVNARTRNANSDPFVLAGRQRVQGVEAGVSGSITSRWTALAAYAFMDSSIAASANAAEEGMNLTLTPEHTFNVWTTFELPRNVTIGGGAQYMDAVFRNTTNTTQVPGYWLAHALVSYRVNELLTLRVNGQNLADEQYVDRVGGGHYIPGPRRQVLVHVDLGF